MKNLLVMVTLIVSLGANAQTDSLRSAKDYIKEKEKTDPNMNGVKRSRFKKPGRATAVLSQPVFKPKKNKK